MIDPNRASPTLIPAPGRPSTRTVELDPDAEPRNEAAAGDGVSDESAPAVNGNGDPVGAYETPDFDFTKTRRGGVPVEWFNGKKWTLTKSVLGKYPRRKQAYLKLKAQREYGMVLNTAFDDKGQLVIQAVKPKKSEKNPLRKGDAKSSAGKAKKTGKKKSKARRGSK